MTTDEKDYIIVFKICKGQNIMQAYNEKRIIIPIDRNYQGEIKLSLHEGFLSRRYKEGDIVKTAE